MITNLKSLLLLGLSATMTIAGPITKARDDSAPSEEVTFTDPAISQPIDAALAASIWADVVMESGTINNTANAAEEAANPLAKRADWCYDYELNNDQVQSWGNAWQSNGDATTWIPASQWRSWAWNDANIKICAVNRYIPVWDGTNVKSWEIGWAMKSIGWDCYTSWSHTKGGRITGHGTNGLGLHIYLTDVGFTCY